MIGRLQPMESMGDGMYDVMRGFFMARGVPGAEPIAAWVTILVMVAVSLGVLLLIQRLIVPLVHRVADRTPTQWDVLCGKCGVFRRAGWLVPAVMLRVLSASWLLNAPFYAGMMRLIAQLWLWVAGLFTVHAFLDAVLAIYNRFPFARQIPIRGFVQAVKLIVSLIVTIVLIAMLMGRSPGLLISGMGAMTAVLMLVFKDPILGFVAGIQLSANRMLAVGDWLEMPKYNADGDVIDITLTTVKVCNWDRTITTIPTYALITDSFKNWRGMSEAGGRRIARRVFIDMTSIHFLDEEELVRLRKLQLLSSYIDAKLEDIESYNREHGMDPSSPVNGRHLTNIGTFRAYLVSYLQKHPHIRQDMIMIVRQLEPTPQGLPLQLYAFVADTRWVQYEGVQSDIFDHVLAVAPEFGLRVYQAPSAADVRSLGQRLSGTGGAGGGSQPAAEALAGLR